MTRRALIVGYGSIGVRHARVLGALGHEVAVVSRRALGDEIRSFATLAEALAIHRPDIVVIADETARHGSTLRALASAAFAGRVLIEKPLVARLAEAPSRHAMPFVPYVAYNLRFHPLLRRLKSVLGGANAITAEIHVGQDLRTWRTNRPYAASYSAHAAEGGGVLRDLSHELDYALWLFGPCRRVAALGGTSAALGIDSDDHALLLLECERCAAVSIGLNTLDRGVRRRVLINTSDATIELDLVKNTLTISESDADTPLSLDRDYTYSEEHRALLDGRVDELCSYDEGLAVVHLVEAAERARAERRWVEL